MSKPQSLSIHVVLECKNHEDETPVRAYTKIRKAQEYAGLRRRSEMASGGRKGFRVVTLPLIVDPSSPAVSGVLWPEKEGTE